MPNSFEPNVNPFGWSYCAPYALSVVTGLTYLRCEWEVLRLRRKYLPLIWRVIPFCKRLTAVTNWEFNYLCRKAGLAYKVNKVPKHQRRSLARTVLDTMTGTHLVFTKNHVVVIDAANNKANDNFTKGWVPATEHPFADETVLYVCNVG